MSYSGVCVGIRASLFCRKGRNLLVLDGVVFRVKVSKEDETSDCCAGESVCSSAA